MKNKVLNYTIFLFCTLLITSNAATAATETFSSATSNTLIGEGTPPFPVPGPIVTGPFNGSVNYTTGLWAAGGVTSAKLRLYLSDDESTNFGSNIDAPREFAELSSVSDGGVNQPGLPTSVEVEPHLFTHPPFSDLEVSTATAAGIEWPNIPPSSAPYFDIDVTNLLNISNTGTLNFSLKALAQYPDITRASNPDAWAMINGILAQQGQNPVETFYVFEDFIFNYAELTVEYNPAPPSAQPIPTLSEWAVLFLATILAVGGALQLRKREQ